MAIDPNIALSAGAGVPPPGNPMLMATQAQALATGAAQNRMTNTNADTAAQGLQQTRTHAIGAIGAGLLALPASMSDGDYFHTVTGTIQNAAANGLFDQATAQRYLSNLGMSQGRKHVNDMILGTVIQNLDPQGRATALIGTMTNRPNGAVDQYGLQNPLRASQGGSGFTPAGPGVTQQLSPGQASTLQTIPNPDGTSRVITGAQAAQEGGLSGIVSPLQFGANGGRNQPVGGPPATNPVVAPQPVAAPPGTLGTTQPRDAAVAQTANATQGVVMGGALTTAADSLPMQRSMLNEMDSALDHIPTGKGQSNIQEYQSWVQSLAPATAKALGIDPQNIATGDTFKKLANNLALSQAQALGMGTDASRTSVFGGNPNFDISTLGNKQIIQILKGNADALEAKANAWRASPQFKTGDYAGFSASFNKGFDPRAYQFHYMDNAARNMMKKSAGPAWPDLVKKITAVEQGG